MNEAESQAFPVGPSSNPQSVPQHWRSTAYYKPLDFQEREAVVGKDGPCSERINESMAVIAPTVSSSAGDTQLPPTALN